MGFEFIKEPTEWQGKIASLINLRLINWVRQGDPYFLSKIILTENYTRPKVSNLKDSKLRSKSLQRQLLNSVLADLKPILPNGKLIDVAGSLEYGRFLGLAEEDVVDLNISEKASYREDAEGKCSNVPRDFFSSALCLNYLLLSKKPELVIKNISSFLKPEGVALIDFIGLSYWYFARDGRHRNSYNPSMILDIVDDNFSDWVIVPIGNFFQAMCNYYGKRFDTKYNTWLIRLGKLLGRFDKSPLSAMHYLVVAKK